jgi:hypothetical protein
MKKIIILAMIIGFMGCSHDEFITLEPETITPESLVINKAVGIKLENIFVIDKVSMNVKLEDVSEVRIKLRSIDGTLISQEKINVKQGDNILSVYTSSLNKSSYTIELTDIDHNVLGKTIFVKQ